MIEKEPNSQDIIVKIKVGEFSAAKTQLEKYIAQNKDKNITQELSEIGTKTWSKFQQNGADYSQIQLDNAIDEKTKTLKTRLLGEKRQLEDIIIQLLENKVEIVGISTVRGALLDRSARIAIHLANQKMINSSEYTNLIDVALRWCDDDEDLILFIDSFQMKYNFTQNIGDSEKTSLLYKALSEAKPQALKKLLELGLNPYSMLRDKSIVEIAYDFYADTECLAVIKSNISYFARAKYWLKDTFWPFVILREVMGLVSSTLGSMISPSTKKTLKIIGIFLVLNLACYLVYLFVPVTPLVAALFYVASTACSAVVLWQITKFFDAKNIKIGIGFSILASVFYFVSIAVPAIPALVTGLYIASWVFSIAAISCFIFPKLGNFLWPEKLISLFTSVKERIFGKEPEVANIVEPKVVSDETDKLFNLADNKVHDWNELKKHPLTSPEGKFDMNLLRNINFQLQTTETFGEASSHFKLLLGKLSNKQFAGLEDVLLKGEANGHFDNKLLSICDEAKLERQHQGNKSEISDTPTNQVDNSLVSPSSPNQLQKVDTQKANKS